MRFYINFAIVAAIVSLVNAAPTPSNDALAFPVDHMLMISAKHTLLERRQTDSESVNQVLLWMPSADSEKRGAALNAVKPDSEERGAALNAVKPDSEKRGAALNCRQAWFWKAWSGAECRQARLWEAGAALNAVQAWFWKAWSGAECVKPTLRSGGAIELTAWDSCKKQGYVEVVSWLALYMRCQLLLRHISYTVTEGRSYYEQLEQE